MGAWPSRSGSRAMDRERDPRAAVVNAAVGWLELSTSLHVEGVGPSKGGRLGLMANPAFFAALCSGALWIALSSRTSRRSAAPAAGARRLPVRCRRALRESGLARRFGVDRRWLRGGVPRRAGLAPRRGTRSGRDWLRAGAAAGRLDLERVRAGERGFEWHGDARSPLGDALDGFVDRPLLGFGPGRSQVATSPRRSLEIAHYEGPDTLYSDAHNVFVEELVTTGVLGFIAFLGWLVLSGRRARGPLAGFAAVAALAMLVEPQFIGLTPLVALAFGAATARALTPNRSTSRSGIVVRWRDSQSPSLLSVWSREDSWPSATATTSTRSPITPSELDAAERTSPPWPQLPGVRAQLLFRSTASPTMPPSGRRALAYERSASERDPADPLWFYRRDRRVVRYVGSGQRGVPARTDPEPDLLPGACRPVPGGGARRTARRRSLVSQPAVQTWACLLPGPLDVGTREVARHGS